MTRLHVMICVICSTIGCARDGRSDPTHTMRDSAGVQIVENFSPSWSEAAGWRVDTNVILDLSGQDDPDFFQPRSPRRLEDGRLVLFNGGTCEIRSYDGSGNLLSAWGRCGEGPGEFENFGGIWPWAGDSLLVVDQRPARVSVFDAEGTLGRTALIPTSDEMPLPYVLGVMDDGDAVVAGLRNPAGRTTPGTETAQRVLGVVDDFEAAPHLIGTYPGPVYEYQELGGRWTRNPLAFSSSTVFAVGRQGLFVGYPDHYEVRRYAPDGTLRLLVRRLFEPVSVTQDDIDWLMERRLDEVEGADNQRLVRQAYRDLRHASVMPAFGVPTWPGRAEGGPDMLVDAEGSLWVFDHYRPGEYRNHWTLFSPNGVWQGNVVLPSRLRPAQIGADFVVGLSTDSLGFVHVRQHRLIKP